MICQDETQFSLPFEYQYRMQISSKKLQFERRELRTSTFDFVSTKSSSRHDQQNVIVFLIISIDL